MSFSWKFPLKDIPVDEVGEADLDEEGETVEESLKPPFSQPGHHQEVSN